MRKRSFLVLLLALALPIPALAGEAAGVKMPDRLEIGGKLLVLNGMGIRKATFLKVKVYVAGLYLEKKSGNAAAILASTQIKRLTLHFVHDASKSQVSGAWKEGFEKNGANLPPLRERIARLEAMMTDFIPGDTLTFTYRPETGVAVDVKGTVRGTIPGDDFARALLSIWLGPEPPNEDLKEGLLGRPN
ncbi:MAG TPA: chalcone isomerase family protein [Polyangiaceae bacterium]|nr:chalcone isomerase family protein [Polyangiaceae bacterium]